MEQYESDSSKLEVSTTAGDGAEDLEFGKGEGGPREGAEDAGPTGGTIAPGPRELIDNDGSWDNLMPSGMTYYMIWLRLFSLALAPLGPVSSCIFEIVDWEKRELSYVHWAPCFLPLLPAFLSERCFHHKFVNERMCHIFSQKP